MDFVAHRERVVEVDGDQHGLPAERADNEERRRFIENSGYRVLRFANREVLTKLAGVVDAIDATLKERRGMKFGTLVSPTRCVLGRRRALENIDRPAGQGR